MLCLCLDRVLWIWLGYALKQIDAQSAHAESTHKGVNRHSADIIQAQQQRPESLSPGMQVNAQYINATRCTAGMWVNVPDVPLLEFMYLVFTRMPGESYRSDSVVLLLCLCDVFPALINSFVLTWA